MIFIPHYMWAENNKNISLHAVQKTPAESTQYSTVLNRKFVVFWPKKKISEKILFQCLAKSSEHTFLFHSLVID